MEQDESIEKSGGGAYPKASLLGRFIAKLIDFLVVATLAEIPFQASFFMGAIYLLIADGIIKGSIGKQLVGLKIVVGRDQQTISFRESILRNVPFAMAYLFYYIPFIGWLVSIGIVTLESLIMIGNPKRVRLGDELAGTRVLEQKRSNFQESRANSSFSN